MQNAASGVKVAEEKYSMGKFRGTWNASVAVPAFNAYAFLPTAPPMKPRVKDVETVSETHEIPVETGEVMDSPPSDADIFVNIKDRFNNYRGYISKDGSCFNNIGNCIGYINMESNEAGSAQEEYLGCLSQMGNECIVEDSVDEVAGKLDMGIATISDHHGRTVAELSNNGVCTGHCGTFLGEFEGMTYKDMKVITLYLVLIDPGMLNEVEG
mmetsp:Transcript_1486/g.2381  ORF Transcript_1486/g.2381 Transcript_1486/m.2381 type:complete len:212 (-) Transcript_1486:158-793(-)|eukprot:CAMPEP_0185026866 /NCGR_PEP_ID=MMETSP1103-20130426/11417_1 /TAXON_ID=36769 /ORGANISM="Paraphysomonas bandaiensis, Strain Caron Lab Isolate" /LENGTH=211 /DNA_ID=CAMNT_0027560597 /DNA_START=24 /DNA_END=659 /DNA_ORIENTATION=-